MERSREISRNTQTTELYYFIPDKSSKLPCIRKGNAGDSAIIYHRGKHMKSAFSLEEMSYAIKRFTRYFERCSVWKTTRYERRSCKVVKANTHSGTQ